MLITALNKIVYEQMIHNKLIYTEKNKRHSNVYINSSIYDINIYILLISKHSYT